MSYKFFIADSLLQIRIVKEESEPQENGIATKKKKKKRPHKGYAFIVYEREKDMKGVNVPHSCPILESPVKDVHG